MGKFGQIASWAARIILAGVFAYASFAKIMRPDQFHNAMANYQILPQGVVFVAAYFLPFLELVCAVALLSKGFFKASASIICIMLLIFIAAIASAWLRGLDIACGCFGGENANGGYPEIIARDILLLALCAVIFLPNRGEKLN